MYKQPAAAGDLEPFGLTQADLEKDVFVWSDCWESVMVFHSLSSQWRMGFSGASGLDYSSLPFMFKIKNIPEEKQAEIFADIQVMEVAAIQQMREKT